MSHADAAPSALGPLREPVFRMLWLAWLAANVTMWTNDVASAWLMTSLTDSTVMVALVAAASTLPVFVLGLPSGALADIVDRRRYFAVTQVWVGVVALVLATLAFTDMLTAPLLLLLTFANGIGMAMRWPVFSAIVPEIVPRANLPAALDLNGVAMNMSRVIGPVIAGTLLASVGSPWVYLLNVVLAAIALILILAWKSVPKVAALPGERFFAAIRFGVQHVAQSPRMRIVIIRIFLFSLQSTALTALLPLIARRLGDGGPATFTSLLVCMGAGGVLVALNLTRLRLILPRDRMVYLGTFIHALAAALVVFSPMLWLAVAGMFIAGMAWIATANSLTLTAQMALPNWVRARGMSAYQMALMGGSAAGATLWGYLASLSSVSTSILAAGISGSVLLVTRRYGVGGRDDEDHTPAVHHRTVAPPVIDIGADDGPLMVTVEYEIDPLKSAEFHAVMQKVRRSRLRQGVSSWGLFRDTTQPGRYVEYFRDENWLEHQRRLERFTAADNDLHKQRLAFHIGAGSPRIQRWVDSSP